VRLYDTLQRSIVDVIPSTPEVLRIYACGPTVYRDAHVGNMRTFLLTDLITRVAQDEGLRTTVVQNITDVGHMADDTGVGGVDEGQGSSEDKLLREASRVDQPALALARAFEAQFHFDCRALNIHPADHYPRASDWIDPMIDLIGTLMDNGHAYVGTDGSVFFDARSFPDYGTLSGNRLDQLKPGHRFEGSVDPAKRFHADWALWKAAGPNRTQLTWPTPWGVGYPGWHTECSAMSTQLLGASIDIHTGGIDLRFPHHEDERAQSNCATGNDVVRTWVHGEHLLFEGRKMSKSAGNVVTVTDVIERGLDPIALRLAFMQHKYRQQMNLTWDVLDGAQSTLNRWRRKVAAWANEPSRPMDTDRWSAIRSAFADDLDTPLALAILHQLENDASVSDGSKCETFLRADHLLGLDLARNIGAAPDVPPAIQRLSDERQAARAERNWQRSDELRDLIMAAGWSITDTPDGPRLEPG
jgi:cysteinyl-tRNA synthetase